MELKERHEAIIQQLRKAPDFSPTFREQVGNRNYPPKLAVAEALDFLVAFPLAQGWAAAPRMPWSTA